MKLKDSYHPYAFTTVFLWSMAFVVTKLAMQHFSALSLGLSRYIIASITLLAVALILKVKPPQKQHIPLFFAAGFFGFFAYMCTFNIGATTLTAATCSVVLATGPIFTALAASIVYKEKLSVLQWIAIGVEFSGILLLTLSNGVLSINKGIFWLLGSAMSVAVYNLLLRKLTKIYPGLQTTMFSIFAGTIMLGIFLPTSVKEIATAPPIQLGYIAFLGIFSSAIAYVCWTKAFEKAQRTSYVSNYMFLNPFLVSILGFLIARELPDKATVQGGVVILIGVFLFNFRSVFPKMQPQIQNEG